MRERIIELSKRNFPTDSLETAIMFCLATDGETKYEHSQEYYNVSNVLSDNLISHEILKLLNGNTVIVLS